MKTSYMGKICHLIKRSCLKICQFEKPPVVSHASNPSVWGTEAEGLSCVQGQPLQYCDTLGKLKHVDLDILAKLPDL